MIHFSLLVIVEFIVGIFLWWVAVFLFAQNPYNRIIRLITGIFICISVYLSTDIFFEAATLTRHFSQTSIILRSMIWTIYLPLAFLYHVSLSAFNREHLKKWQRLSIYFVYLSAFISIGLESFTDLTRKYEIINSEMFNGDLTMATGRFFWIPGLFLVATSMLILMNFRTKLSREKKFTPGWNKYFWPTIGISISTVLAPIIILSYYRIVPHSALLSGLSFIIMSVPLYYSVMRYNLFIPDTKIIFGKNFLYSTISILVIVLLTVLIFMLSRTSFDTVESLIMPFLLINFIIVSHPFFNWVSTFANDILYNINSGLSVVNDQEITDALRDYCRPEKLEQSSLLRLGLINTKIHRDRSTVAVDELRNTIENAIEYFKPKETTNRRTKRNLKYHLLTMLAYDQAEEGQILWELGFEEYPVRVMTNSSKNRPPIFQVSSPSDYTYTSRNAYLALKKEAIHDITWRISYLEKSSKRRQ